MQIDSSVPQVEISQARSTSGNLSGDGTFQRTLRQLEDRPWKLVTAPSTESKHVPVRQARAVHAQEHVSSINAPAAPVQEKSFDATLDAHDEHDDDVEPPISVPLVEAEPAAIASLQIARSIDAVKRSEAYGTATNGQPPIHVDASISKFAPQQSAKTADLASDLHAAPDVICRKTFTVLARLTVASVGDASVIAIRTPDYFPFDVTALRKRVGAELAEYGASLGTLVVNGQSIELIQGKDNAHRRN